MVPLKYKRRLENEVINDLFKICRDYRFDHAILWFTLKHFWSTVFFLTHLYLRHCKKVTFTIPLFKSYTKRSREINKSLVPIKFSGDMHLSLYRAWTSNPTELP